MRILTAAGNFPGAFEALERAEEVVVRRTGQPRWLEMIEAFRARLHAALAAVRRALSLENIYDKLDTRSRTQAIARAREIGLL